MSGRPPKYSTPEEMEKAIDDYFAKVHEQAEKDLCGRKVLNCPSLSELAIELGFADRFSLYDYEERDQFCHTIKQIRAKMCSFYEKYGATGLIPPAFVIFMLKNYGYSDKQEIEHTGKDGGAIATTINIIGVQPKTDGN